MRVDAIALTVLFVLVLGLIYRRNRASIKAERAAMFAACLPLVENYRLVQDDMNFPVLTGTYRGHDLRAEPVADHVGFRKIPSLWLLVTIKREVPVQGTFDLLARPQNIEFFSPGAELAEHVPVPQGWPADAVIKMDNPDAVLMKLLEPHVLAFFADPKAKELVVTPRGVRVVYQANQVQRGEYLVLRALTFDHVAFSPAIFSALLDRAIAVADDLTSASRYLLGENDAQAA